jgi:hypothetical protein
MLTPWLRAVVAGIAASLVTLVPMAHADASCVAVPPLPESLASARVMFVGTVLSTSNNARIAEVHVESVWKGPRMRGRVTVQGSPATETNIMTTVDRHYSAGHRYLFVPSAEPTARMFVDSACTATTEYTSAVAKYAPRGRATHATHRSLPRAPR